MKTEVIASTKNVTVANRELVIVSTVSGAVVWVPKAQFNDNAETITFNELKKGDEYINRITKEPAKLKADRNEFVGYGKQIVRKYSSVELLDELVSRGITPTFALS